MSYVGMRTFFWLVISVNQKYGNKLNADTTIIDVAGRPLQALYTYQLADENAGINANGPCEITSTEYTCPLEPQNMLKEEYANHYKLSDRLVAKVAVVKKPVSRSEVETEFGVSAYSKHATRTVNPLLTEIGTCRFDKTSVATLSCKQTDGKWRPPSVICCNALLHSIDHLPTSNESGACCLCRYLQLRYPNDGHGLVSSYVLCQGKDMHTVTKWSSFPVTSCHTVCRQEKSSSSGMSNPVQKNHPVGNVHGSGNKVIKIPWTFVSVAFCMILLICLWHLWWSNPAANACQPQSLPLNRSQKLSSEGNPQTERRLSSGRLSSAQLKERRLSFT
uniref:Uncharacterized protein n=1 Tax=Oryza brachyantha TaxID=4533 RepID=J3NBG5_ORYBR